jgi:lipoyl(octanoyl) transferase
MQRLGCVEYEKTLERMRAFTATRTAETVDEMWLLEHPPVYTLGVRARHRRLDLTSRIPTVTTDRGGDITYHGPGQAVLYVLIDLARRGLGIHALVRQLEQATIDVLTELGIPAERRDGAPGVYVEDCKIASLGLRVRGGRSYHGVSLNAHMDLAPFHAIDPCGYPGLRVTQVAKWRPEIGSAEVGERLLGRAASLLGYTQFAASANPSAATPHSNARR